MLEEIKKFIKDQKFDRAIAQIESCLAVAETQEEKLELLQLRLKISKDEQTIKQLLKLAFELKNYSTFISTLKFSKKINLITQFHYAVSLYHSGSLHQSFKEFSQLIEKCFECANIQILKRVLSFEVETPILREIHDRADYYLMLLCGSQMDISKVKKVLDEKFGHQFYRHSTHFKFDQELHSLQLSLLLRDNEREKFVKGVLEYLALFGITDAIIALISEYAIRYKRINLGHATSKWNEEFAALFPERVNEGDVEFGDIDSAEDLFAAVGDDESNLRSKITALLKLSQVDQARAMLREHLQTQPHSQLAREFKELLAREQQGTTVRKQMVDVQGIMGQLLRLTDKNNQQVDSSYDLNQNSLKHHLEYLGTQFIKENFRDLISCFIMLEFYEVALWVTEQKILSDSENKLEARFLRCDVYLLCGKYHYCLDETLAIWDEHDLNFDEELEILYKRAECYRLMGNREKAAQLYREVFARDQTYRLAKIRLQEFE